MRSFMEFRLFSEPNRGPRPQTQDTDENSQGKCVFVGRFYLYVLFYFFFCIWKSDILKRGRQKRQGCSTLEELHKNCVSLHPRRRFSFVTVRKVRKERESERETERHRERERERERESTCRPRSCENNFVKQPGAVHPLWCLAPLCPIRWMQTVNTGDYELGGGVSKRERQRERGVTKGT